MLERWGGRVMISGRALSYRQKGRRRADVGWGGGNGRGVTRKFDIMEWGDGVSGNWEVRYHLKCKRIISNKNMLVLLF